MQICYHINNPTEVTHTIWCGTSNRSTLYGVFFIYFIHSIIVGNFPLTICINAILESQHDEFDNSGTISDIKEPLLMYDLTLRGLEDAVKKLMEEN